jgi:hypothetical protein
MEGAFDVQPCVGRTGQCVQQETPARPLEWGSFSSNTFPYTAGGGLSWGNYQVSADVMNKVAGSAGIVGRQKSAGEQANNGEDPTKVKGYWLSLSNTGAWAIKRSDFSSTMTTLASGTVASAAGLGTWHRLALTLNGSTITALVDGTTVGTVTDTSYSAGKVGLFTGGYTPGDQFANLTVTSLGGGSTTGNITSGFATNKCMDVNTGSTTNGTKVQVWDCNTTAAQQWSMQSDGSIRNQGKCLDLYNGFGNGALLEIWDCNGGSNQKWQSGSNNSLVNPTSGRCIDLPNWNTTNGTQLDVWDCNGGGNQRWTLP